MQRICVYCGSSDGRDPNYLAAARALGSALVERDISLVYGGASIGLMGAVANAVMQGGGEVIGIIPQSLDRKEVTHYGLSDLRVVNSMHERKAQMADLSDGFIALPGGLGTLEELFECLTWSQLGIHRKPCGVLNIDGYYDQLLQFVDQTVSAGFVKGVHRDLLLSAEQADPLLEKMHDWQPPEIEKWLTSDEV